MTIRHRDTAHRLLSVTTALGRGTTFCIFDVMDEAHWYQTVAVDGDRPLVLGGALSGALEGLRRFGVTPADVLSCPVVSPGGAVTEEDMTVAAGWLATGLLQEADSMLEQTLITTTLQNAGWTRNPARVMSLVLAIAITAGHAEDNDRA
ncbi:hypothetical protein [Microbacterium sp. NPDC055665]